MSEYDDEFYEDDDQPQESNPVRARMKQLEKEAKDLRKQVAEAQAAQKELAFAKAGIDLNSPMAKYFVKGYDGELTPEAIRMAAEEAQLVAPQKQVEDTDKAGWQESNKIASGAVTAPNVPSWIDRINEANSESELLEIFAEAQAQGIDLSQV
jgi:hypothetical protein